MVIWFQKMGECKAPGGAERGAAMKGYGRKYGTSPEGLSPESHRVAGRAVCQACGAVVALNQEGKLWQHDVPETSPARNPKRPVQSCENSWRAGEPYCTQNGGDCNTCSLVNYGRDCRNNTVTRR